MADVLKRQTGFCGKREPASGMRRVASQCAAYEPFPPPRWMVPLTERKAAAIGREIAAGKERPIPAMSPLTKALYPKLMVPFLNVQQDYDKGFYVSDACTGWGICRRVCPCGNIRFRQGRPVWNHGCEGCNACVVYCPAKAIQFQTPEAYRRRNNPITRRLGLPESRTRYHNPYIAAADLAQDGEEITGISREE